MRNIVLVAFNITEYTDAVKYYCFNLYSISNSSPSLVLILFPSLGLNLNDENTV